MSAELDRIAERLVEIAALLGASETDDGMASELAAEAADLAGKAGAAVEGARRIAADAVPGPGPDESG